jgi:hypothetical protein
VVTGCFEAVADFAWANPFTNANKIMDHVLAYGARWKTVPAPYLHGRHQLPPEYLATAFDWLEREQLLPERGYLEE